RTQPWLCRPAAAWAASRPSVPLQCCEGRLRAAFFFADHGPSFNRRPKPTTVAPILCSSTIFSENRFTLPDHAPLLEDDVDARAAGLPDNSFGRSACGVAAFRLRPDEAFTEGGGARRHGDALFHLDRRIDG